MFLRAAFLSVVATALTVSAQAKDLFAGDYRQPVQIDSDLSTPHENVVFIAKVSDVANTYFVSILTLSTQKTSCDFQQEMTLSSNGKSLEFRSAKDHCQVSITKDALDVAQVKAVCPSACGAAVSLEGSGLGYSKMSDIESITRAGELAGD